MIRHFHKKIWKKVHGAVYDKPYDINPLDWIGALLRFDLSPKKLIDIGVVLW